MTQLLNEKVESSHPSSKQSYESFKSILNKCDKDDFTYLVTVLHSNMPFAKTSPLKSLLAQYNDNYDSSSVGLYKLALVDEIDKSIRYFGSSNLAYIKRSIANTIHDNQKTSGVTASEIVYDVFSKLRVKNRIGPASIETRLERLVKKVVEKELLKMTPEQLNEAFKAIGMGEADANSILEKIKLNGKFAILPALVNILGPEITLKVIETIIVGMVAQITGQEAARQLMKELLKRNPWVNTLGPIIWVLSSSWFAYDIQGPAFRKTIPVCLYLGIVSLRD